MGIDEWDMDKRASVERTNYVKEQKLYTNIIFRCIISIQLNGRKKKLQNNEASDPVWVFFSPPLAMYRRVPSLCIWNAIKQRTTGADIIFYGFGDDVYSIQQLHQLKDFLNNNPPTAVMNTIVGVLELKVEHVVFYITHSFWIRLVTVPSSIVQ